MSSPTQDVRGVRPRGIHASLVLFGVATLAACGTTGVTDEETRTTEAVADVEDPSSEDASGTDDPTEMVPDPTPVACPDPNGGGCLGQLAAGAYETSVFSPAISYTVPDGWTNLEDLPGNFLLVVDDGTYDGDPEYLFAGDPRYVGIYRNVFVPLPCDEARDPDVDQSVEAYVDWLTNHPGLEAGEPESVTVGGVEGVQLDLALAPSWTGTCVYSEGQPVVPFIIGSGVSHLHHVLLPSNEVRLFLFEYGDDNLAIEVSPEGRDLGAFLAEAMPIIEQLQFAAE